MISQKIAIWWCLIVVCLCGWSVVQTQHHWSIQTDILGLLPKHDADATVRSLKRLVSEKLGRKVLILVSHVRSQVAREVTHHLGSRIELSPLFADTHWKYHDRQQAFFDLYFPLRYQILSPLVRQHLLQEDGYHYLLKRLKRELYQPTSVFATRFLEADPLLFFPEVIKSWTPPAGPLRIADGLLGTQHDGKYHYVITATLAANPFEKNTQVRLEKHWQAWVHELHSLHPDLELVYMSVARFAASARRQMQRDLLVISIGSMLGIIGLIVGTFRSLRHLFLALIPLAVGLWSAIGLSLCIFGELHALTLVFGASLLGIYIDYSFHYFAHHRIASSWQPCRAMWDILPALSLGAITTLLSYIGLGLTPLVGLQQIAVFASCGMVVTFLTVVCVYPFLLPKPHPRAHRLPLLYLTAWQRFRMPLYSLLLVMIVIGMQGILHLQVDDRPQALSAPSADVATQERRMRQIMGLSQTQRYLMVEGSTTEDALQRLEALHDRIRTEPDHYGVGWGPILTDFVPSQQRQRANVQALRQLLRHRPEISQQLLALGFPAHVIESFFRQIETPPELFLSPEVWQHHNASQGLRELWLGETSQGAAIWVPMNRLTDVERLQQAMAGLPGIRYVDQVADFTRVLQRYRHKAMRLVGLAYVVIFAVLLWRYRAQAVVVMLPPVLAAFLTLGLLGLLGQAVNLMHCLALVLLLGMGIDYTIFIVESTPSAQPAALLALTLSALTTVLSFGLLSLSGQAMLKAIGLTTLIGICCAWLLAPLAMHRRSL